MRAALASTASTVAVAPFVRLTAFADARVRTFECHSPMKSPEFQLLVSVNSSL